MLSSSLLESTPYSLKYGEGVSVKDYVDDLQSSTTELQTGHFNQRSVSADYTTSGEVVIGVDTSGGAVTITLASSDADAGKIVIIKDEGGASGTDAITIATEGSETIDGSASTSISTNYGVVRLYSDGTNWFTW